MQSAEKVVRTRTADCGRLAMIGLLDARECCPICHSADEHAASRSLGPCCVKLPDGRDAFVCCAGKKRLLEERNYKVAQGG